MSDGSAKTIESSRSARAEASVWIVRLNSEENTAQLKEGLRAWLAAHPDNAVEFEHLTDMWEMGGAITAEGLPRVRSWRPTRAYRQWAAGTAIAATALFALLLWYQRWAHPTFTTDHGEQRQVQLEDGSRIALNSDTRLHLEFGETQRRIVFDRGEALFEVARDARRPFSVRVGDRQVTALGTTFVVRYDPNRTDVILVDGKVSVSESAGPSEKLSAKAGVLATEPQALTLVPGQRLTLARSERPRIDSPRIEAVTAWRRGEVLLDATPLNEAISEMNRYDERQLVIDEPALSTVRVSGVYRTGDSPGFARAVAELHGLAIDENKDQIHLRSR